MRRSKESQKRSKLIFLIIIIAALISITGTYAWFSTQRDVEIVGFKINVEIAENLEISLDGEHWTHTLNVENMRQFYGTYVDFSEDTPVYQAKADDNRNYVPTELLPVSTVGNVLNGELLFATGDVKDNKLTNLTKCSEADITKNATILSKETKNDQHPYLVFDMYLRNLSRLTAEGDTLQLNTGSYVSATGTNTGLENSIRVGFVQYDNTVSIHEQDDLDEDGAVTKTVGEKIRAIASSDDADEGTTAERVAIWEPNSKFHIPFVVSDDDRITAKVQAIDTRAIADVASEDLPTEIADVTDDEEELLQVVSTNKPVQSEETEDIEAKKYETTELHDLTYISGDTMKLDANVITKVRCYIWLEGQDPDCIDLASTGEEVVATIRLIKPKSNAQGDNSYAEPNEE